MTREEFFRRRRAAATRTLYDWSYHRLPGYARPRVDWQIQNAILITAQNREERMQRFGAL